jgi:hypothetical protein
MIFLYPKALLLLFILSKSSGAQLLSHLGPTSLASQMTIIGLYEIRVLPHTQTCLLYLRPHLQHHLPVIQMVQ